MSELLSLGPQREADSVKYSQCGYGVPKEVLGSLAEMVLSVERAGRLFEALLLGRMVRM